MAKRSRRPRAPAPPKQETPSDRWVLRPDGLLFLLACAAALVPVWIVTYFPSQDGPIHVDTAHAVLRYNDAALPVFRQYYELHPGVGPNWLVTLLLSGLMNVFAPEVAEKIVVSGYILTAAFALRYAISAIAADNRWLALFAPLVVYNVPLHMGFYNFSYSVALFPLVVGFWIRHHPRWTVGKATALGALALLLFFIHPVSLIMAGVAIAVGTLWPWRGLRPSLATFAAFLPSIVALLLFLFRPDQTDVSHMRRGAPFRIDDFLFLRSFDAVEIWFCGAVFALLAVLVGHRVLTRARAAVAGHHHGLLVAVPIYLAIYALVPDFMLGGGMLKMRLAVYPVLVLLLWASAARFGTWFRRLVVAAMVTLLAVQVGFYASRYRMIDERLAEFHSAADQIEPGSTVLPLVFDSWGTTSDGKAPLAIRGQPFLHAVGRIAAQRRAMNLLNTQGAFDYFAVRFRPALNPYDHITPVEKAFHRAKPIEFLTYPERTGGRVDYVLIWGLQQGHLRSPSVQAITRQLTAGYDRIAASPGGRMQLYRRKRVI